METVILTTIGTLLNLVCAFAPLYIIGFIIGFIIGSYNNTIKKTIKNITMFDIITIIFCFPLSIFYWGPIFISTLTFPIWFEIAAGIGMILMLINLIRNKN